MAENIPEELYNPNYHWKFTTHQFDKRRGKAYEYTRIRPRARLDAAPLRELLERKRSAFDSMREMAEYIGIEPRALNRIYYNECDRTHINIADRICMGFDTSLRDLYGE